MYSLNPEARSEAAHKAIMASDRANRTIALLDEAMSLIGQIAQGDFAIPFDEERATAMIADDIAMARDTLAVLIGQNPEYRHNLAALAEARERGRRAVQA